jgi:hypothetical protein
MKRKLIEFDVFERIKQDSLSNAQRELEEASSYLAKALNLEAISLNCYGSEDVIFESVDGSYVHANYKIDNGFIEFDNVQELIINEESERAKSRETLSEMLDCLIESKEKEAEELFEQWMGLPGTKRIFTEARKRRVVPVRKNGKATGKYKIAYWNDTPKTRQSAKTKLARAKGKKMANKKRSDSKKKFMAMNRKRAGAGLGKMMKEWNVLAENVLGYVDYQENGPVLQNSQVKRDESGSAVSVRIPTTKLRNEAKMLQFNWKTLHTDVVVKRNSSKKVHEDVEFAKAIADIKKQNALSDDSALTEALEKTAYAWPQIIYLTQDELSSRVKVALESVGATNYDDQTCEFIAEGLLRTAHEIYTDKINKILKLSGATVSENSQDKYSEFKSVVEQYYKNLDESTTLEMQVFVDLYETLRSVHELAKEESNVELAVEASEYLDDLLKVITQESEPSLELASEAASWLYDLVETNLETMDWSEDSPVVTASGEHPVLAKKARTSYAPASDFAGKDNRSSASQGKGEDASVTGELENDGFSNEGGEGVYPSLDNPYLLNNGEYKIKGETDVDSDSGQLAHWGSSETWPNLQNPYVKNTGSVSKEVE